MMLIHWTESEPECDTDDSIRDNADWGADHDAYDQSFDDTCDTDYSPDFHAADRICHEAFYRNISADSRSIWEM